MIITKLAGVLFNQWGNTKDILPHTWVRVDFNFRMKNHREARDSEQTQIIKRIHGWGGTRKYPKPILSYWTNTKNQVDCIKETGDILNSIKFILED